MAIRFICDRCHVPLDVPDDAAGRLAQCPKCLAVGRVPVEPRTVDRAVDDTAEHPVLPLTPIAAELDLTPVRRPSLTGRRFRAGFAWGAGFWLAGLIAVGIAAGARAVVGWVAG